MKKRRRDLAAEGLRRVRNRFLPTPHSERVVAKEVMLPPFLLLSLTFSTETELIWVVCGHFVQQTEREVNWWLLNDFLSNLFTLAALVSGSATLELYQGHSRRATWLGCASVNEWRVRQNWRRKSEEKHKKKTVFIFTQLAGTVCGSEATLRKYFHTSWQWKAVAWTATGQKKRREGRKKGISLHSRLSSRKSQHEMR
jgi:hypothetical protein